jgi:hypothetical protein
VQPLNPVDLTDREARVFWLNRKMSEIAGVFGQGYAETLEYAISMGDNSSLMKWLPGTWTETGWIPPDGLPDEGYMLIGEALSFFDKAMPWFWADWILQGERRHGETYVQAVNLSGKRYNTLAGYVWTGRRFEYERRRLPPVTYSHHAKVAPKRFTESEQDRWLAWVQDGGKSVDDLADALRQKRKAVYAVEAAPRFEWLEGSNDGDGPAVVVIENGAEQNYEDGQQDSSLWQDCSHCGGTGRVPKGEVSE